MHPQLCKGQLCHLRDKMMLLFSFWGCSNLGGEGWTVLTYLLLSILPMLSKVSLAGQGEARNRISSNSLSSRVWLALVHEMFSDEIGKMEERESHSLETIAVRCGGSCSSPVSS